MTLDDIRAKIEALNKKAEPLRRLDPDDERQYQLTAIVDQINALRRQEMLAESGYMERNTPGASMPVSLVEEDVTGMSMNEMKKARR